MGGFEKIYEIIVLVIRYGIWAYFGFDVLIKSYFLIKARTKLGKSYKSIPNIDKLSGIRKLSIAMTLLLFGLLLYAALINGTPIYLPFVSLLIGLSLYLGGKLQKSFGFAGSMLYSEKGFILYHSNALFTFLGFKLHRWDSIEKVVWHKNMPFTKWIGRFYFKDKTLSKALMCSENSRKMVQDMLAKKNIEVKEHQENPNNMSKPVSDPPVNLN